MIRTLCRLSLAIFMILVLTSPALAHKVNIITYASNGFIHTESCLGEGHPVVGGTVEVCDFKHDTPLRIGVTDSEGKFSFPITEDLIKNKPNLLLIIKAGLGHQAQVSMPAEQYLAAKK